MICEVLNIQSNYIIRNIFLVCWIAILTSLLYNQTVKDPAYTWSINVTCSICTVSW